MTLTCRDRLWGITSVTSLWLPYYWGSISSIRRIVNHQETINNYWMRCLWYPELSRPRQVMGSWPRLGLSASTSGWYLFPRPWLFWISQKPNLIIVLLYIERKKCHVSGADGLLHVFASSLTGNNTKRANRVPECPWHSYCIVCSYDVRKFTVRFRPIIKELEWCIIISDMCGIFNYYSSSPNGLWVNSPWGRRPNGLIDSEPMRARGIIVLVKSN